MYKVGDKLVLHFRDGHDYKVEVVNVNDSRLPEERYGVDMWNDEGIYYGDVYFCGEDFLSKCTPV